MKQFDLVNAPLSGTNLIEAGAGTGKTYAIESLFLRLIIEKKLSVDRILVVTFTKAATGELKERIRNKLICAKDAFAGKAVDDGLIRALYAKYEDRKAVSGLMEKAVLSFNEASIFTIHGFCSRILSEFSFETGSLFDTELVTDQTDLIREIAEDFWRIVFYGAEKEFISHSLKKLKNPAFFSNLFQRHVSFCKKIIPSVEKPQFETLLHEYRQMIQDAKNVWAASKEEIKSKMRGASLKENIYGKIEPKEGGISGRDEKISSFFSGMERFLDERCAGFPLFDKFEYFTAEKINKSVKAKQAPPSHRFFNLCGKIEEKSGLIEDAFNRYIIHLKKEFIRYADSELIKRKKKQNIQHYEDLLVKVKNALAGGDGGRDLAVKIRQRYGAALIDEFQDTDPVQYEIFSNLFDLKDGVLFIIGDPKQAIYGFRGADIFSYIKAAEKAESRNTLTENWRSDPGLVDAVNAVFSSTGKPFVFDEIDFIKGFSGLGKEPAERISSGAHLVIWHMFSDDNTEKNKAISKTDAVSKISESVATEIFRLTGEGKAESGEITEKGDIAVLVRTNDQARAIKDSLSRRRINSVISSQESVFESREAGQLERILEAVSDPSNVIKIKSALVTDIMGVTGEEFDITGGNPGFWDGRQAVFAECNNIWSRHGFIAMFRRFMEREKVKDRLVRFHDGERRVTNLIHLAEILHRISKEKNTGIKGLVRWLSGRREQSGEKTEEYLLRLESDDDAVKIVTIHKSKGLEFPVVFCPFNWGGSEAKGEEIIYHEQGGERNRILDLACDKKSVRLAGSENLAENIRLLYVSLTRAKKKCYLVWGRINSAETSAMAYLFHYARGRETSGEEDIIKSLGDFFASKDDAELLEDLEDLEKRGCGSIRLSHMPVQAGTKYDIPPGNGERLFSRNFTGHIDDAFRTVSYSSITARSRPDSDIKDVDAVRTEMPEDGLQSGEYDRKSDIYSFPKGAGPGTFFHDLFENMDYSDKERISREKLVSEKLAEYGFDIAWKTPVCEMLERVLMTDLNTKYATLRLSGIDPENRVNEMQFYFPLQKITPLTLKKLFHDPEAAGISDGHQNWTDEIVFAPVKGFMKGYIDMVFHNEGKFFIVDWKSNYLGNRPEDYSDASIYGIMMKESYILQYHLYALALHQYLKLNTDGYDYESSFGGVFYIFIRGVDPCYSGSGVYYDLPDAALVERLGKALIPGYVKG
jgi:exodeoxyribonuclease V beta subunit